MTKTQKVMIRKIIQGEIRNKEKTKEKLIKAVGTILQTKGFSFIKVNTIAAESGVNKRLIYEYFGGIEGLIDAYISKQDYWSFLKGNLVIDAEDNGKQVALDVIKGQFEEMRTNKELQKMMLWELSENRKSLCENANNRELFGNQILSTFGDPYFKENAGRFRAIMALLISGVNYLNIHSDINGSTFCGLDLKTEQDRQNILNAIDFIINQAFEQNED